MTRLHATLIAALVATAAVPATTAPVLAVQPQAPAAPGGYQLPPSALTSIVDAPLTPNLGVGPDQRTLMIMTRRPMPTLADISAPELKLAGLSIDPATNGEARASTYQGLAFRTVDDPTPRPLKGLPANPRISHVAWSPDGTQVAFTLTRATGIEVWVAAIATAQARRLGQFQVNGVMGMPLVWWPDGKSLLVRGRMPVRKATPSAGADGVGPVVQENLGGKAPSRTYPNLLKNTQDEALFDHYAASQLWHVDLAGRARPIGKPALYTGAKPSPDGKWLLVDTIERPYSYLVPLSRFPRRTEVWTAGGARALTVSNLPLAEQMSASFDAVRAGRRWVAWRPDQDAGLYWAEAADGGDPAVAATVRDRLFTQHAPFHAAPTRLIDLGYRATEVEFTADGVALVSEGWWKTRHERSWVVKPGAAPKALFNRSSEDLYGNPGSPLTRRTARNTFVLATTQDRQSVLFAGEGASPQGNRPFLNRVNLFTNQTTMLWRSEAPHYAYVVHVFDTEGARFMVSRETPTEPPNFYLAEKGQLKQLTRFAHPTPQLANVQKELITYKRADGVKLNGTLYLPPGYDPKRDGPLPLIMWAYPQEFKSADAAGQVDSSPYAFNRIWHSSPLVWLSRGYAVLDDPKLPIIGVGTAEPNDTYVEQLVAGAQAAVDEVVRRGVADRRRIAVGGHSYGAFMTANLLAHSDLFAAGIARSGAYNRTLTPFGFQAEERSFWEVPGIYHKMSPFENAHKINEPLLLIHGQADSNPGTFPMQSERLYQAMKGLGGRARLVMLPHEEHGYRARESVLHMLYESDRWLETFVKHRQPDAAPAKAKP